MESCVLTTNAIYMSIRRIRAKVLFDSRILHCTRVYNAACDVLAVLPGKKHYFKLSMLRVGSRYEVFHISTCFSHRTILSLKFRPS